MSLKVKTDLSGVPKKIDNICTNDKVGKFMAESLAKYMEPYVPMDTGTLAQSYTTEPFKVTYTQPYAHNLYTGDNFNFSKEKHLLACAYWDKPAKSAKGSVMAQETSRFIERM